MAVATLVMAGTTIAAGATTETVVRSDAFADADLTTTTINCSDPTIPSSVDWTPGNALGPDKAPQGQRSLTFAVTGSGSAIGPTFRVADPTTLSSLSVAVHPSAGPLVGFAVVTLYPNDDPGYWQGLASLGTDTERTWHRVEAADRSFTWRHFDASGRIIGTAGAQTLSQFLPTVGGDGEGAELAFVYGCNGEPFYLDDLVIETAATSRAWDFEGATATIAAKPRRGTVSLGRRIQWDTAVDTTLDRPTLPVEVQAKFAGRKRVAVVDEREIALPESTVQLTPIHSGRYRFVIPNSDELERAVSPWRDIAVRMIVRGDSTVNSVKLGDSFRVRGNIRPTDRGTDVLVQRRTSKGWQTAASSFVRAGERISMLVRATTAGKQVYRLLARPTQLNAGDTSKTFTISVTAPPSGGGGGGGGTDDGGGGGGGGGGEDPPDGPQRPAA